MARNGETTDKNLGFKEIYRQLKLLEQKPFTKVGVQADAAEHVSEGAGGKSESTPMAMIASANEYGTQDGRVPERSFIRTAIDQNQGGLEQLTARYQSEIYKGTLNVNRALGFLGSRIQALIQNRIRSNIPPENAPATIARKGPGKGTLIDTGQLIRSIRYVVLMEGKGS